MKVDRDRSDPSKRQASTLAEALNPRRLRPVIVESLFAAYDLRGRARFYLGEVIPLKTDGALLITLDPSRPEGYHWIGIASSREGEGKYDLAVSCYQQSVNRSSNRDSGPNKDNINLAEYFFLNGDYEKSKHMLRTI